MKVLITKQSNYLSMKVTGHKTAMPEAGRGEIKEFSPASRKRMMEMMARLDWDRAGRCTFLTLTYPDEVLPGLTPERSSDHLKAYRKRLERRWGKMAIIWRREWQHRKSGLHIGADAPHFHLMILACPFMPWQELQACWHGVIQSEDIPRIQVEEIQNKRKANFYLSKYMSKPVEKDIEEEGEGEAEASLLVNVAKKAAEGESVGRAWGVINRKLLPFGKSTILKFNFGDMPESVIRIQEVAQEIYGKVGDHGNMGFTLFADEKELNRIVEYARQEIIKRHGWRGAYADDDGNVRDLQDEARMAAFRDDMRGVGEVQRSQHAGMLRRVRNEFRRFANV